MFSSIKLFPLSCEWWWCYVFEGDNNIQINLWNNLRLQQTFHHCNQFLFQMLHFFRSKFPTHLYFTLNRYAAGEQTEGNVEWMTLWNFISFIQSLSLAFCLLVFMFAKWWWHYYDIISHTRTCTKKLAKPGTLQKLIKMKTKRKREHPTGGTSAIFFSVAPLLFCLLFSELNSHFHLLFLFSPCSLKTAQIFIKITSRATSSHKQPHKHNHQNYHQQIYTHKVIQYITEHVKSLHIFSFLLTWLRVRE